MKTADSPRIERKERMPDGHVQFQDAQIARRSIVDGDYARLRDAVLQLMSIDLLHYRTLQMERRLISYLDRSGQGSWGDYIQLLHRQPEEAKRFLEFLTINVSSFYRDADKWTILAEKILPELLRRNHPYGLQAWSIGCSLGAEPYSLSMLLCQLAPTCHHTIDAGDIDPSILEVAKAGGPYSSNDLRELPPKLNEKFIVADDNHQFWVRPEIRRSVHFERFNLLQDRAPHLYDLIICRNLLIYFTPAIREQVIQELALAVKPGGVLFIGSTETFSNCPKIT